MKKYMPFFVEDYGNGRGKFKTILGRMIYKKIPDYYRNCLTKEESKILYTYKYNAKRRKLDFKLTESVFKILINLPCRYCNSNKKLNGIDRVDSSKCYTFDNCISCCSYCNRAKLDEDFIDFDEHMEETRIRKDIYQTHTERLKKLGFNAVHDFYQALEFNESDMSGKKFLKGLSITQSHFLQYTGLTINTNTSSISFTRDELLSFLRGEMELKYPIPQLIVPHNLILGSNNFCC